MKKRFLALGILLVAAITLLGCNSMKIREDQKKAKAEAAEKKKNSKEKEEKVISADAKKFKEEYESLNGKKNDNGKEYRNITISEDNLFVYASAKDIVNLINDEKTFIVYFGFNKCPWCRSILPTLDSVAKDNGVDKIYYVDIYDIRDTMELSSKDKPRTIKEGTKDYYKLLDKLDDVLSDYTLVNKKDKEIKTGEKRIYAPNIVVVVDGEAKKMTTGISDKQEDGYSEITDEIKKDMKKQIKEVVETYVETNATCNVKGDQC